MDINKLKFFGLVFWLLKSGLWLCQNYLRDNAHISTRQHCEPELATVSYKVFKIIAHISYILISGTFPDAQLPSKRIIGPKNYEFLKSKREEFQEYLQVWHHLNLKHPLICLFSAFLTNNLSVWISRILLLKNFFTCRNELLSRVCFL